MKNIHDLVFKLSSYVCFIICFLIITSCTEDEVTPREYPRITNLSVGEISSDGVTFSAEISHPGNNGILEHGFLWSEDKSLTLTSAERVSLGKADGAGTFQAKINFGLKENQEYFFTAYAISEKHLVYGSVISFNSKGSKKPEITFFEPQAGFWGDTISVTGRNFSRLKENISLKFATYEAEILESTDTTILCIVPQHIPDTKVPLRLTVVGNTTTSDNPFNLHTPVFESFYPKSGTYGDVIEIKGSHFSSVKKNVQVLFNDKSAEIIECTGSLIKVRVPSSIREKINTIHVISDLKKSAALEVFNILPPHITSLSKVEGFMGTSVTLYGTNFCPDISGNKVSFNGTEGQLTAATNESITVELPESIYKSRSFKVELAVAEQKAASPQTFTILDPWIQKNDIPHGQFGRGWGVGTSLSGKGYAGLGTGNDLYEYDPTTNIWSRIPDYPGETFYGNTAFALGNYLYVGLGSDYSGNGANNFWRYDPVTTQWKRMADFPALAKRAVALTIGDKAYVCTKASTYNFWEYDPALDQWIQKPDLETISVGAKGMADAGFVIGEKIYIYATGGSTGLQQLYEYDTQTELWTRRSDLPHSNFQRNATGFSINEKGYLITEYYFYEYDHLTDNWTRKSSYPGQHRYAAVSFVIDHNVYFGAGSNGSTGLSDFWEFSPLYP